MVEGTQIGTYRIERELGQGGYGVVYVGVDPRLGRRAAIKRLLPELSDQREIVERFFNEAKAAASINHPGIVEIYDVGWHDGSAYFAMKLVDGDSLAKRLRATGPMQIELAATIARQVSSALVAAHAQGIIHRDLKPDNIILTRDDEVTIGERAIVLDFGIAKLARNNSLSNKTRTGVMMGTPDYMSPEQCRGAGEVDHRTDIYALGCILFEMLSGRPPFLAEGAGEVLGMHLFIEPPALRTLRFEVPPELELLVMRALAKNPHDRPETMSEFMAALQRFSAVGGRASEPNIARSASVASDSTPTRREVSQAAYVANQPPRQSTYAAARGEVAVTPTPRRRRVAWLVAGFAIAAAAVVVVVAATRSPSPPPQTPAASSVAPVAIDAPVVGAVPVDAPMVLDAAIDAADAERIRVVCRSYVIDRKWAELETCANTLRALDPTTSSELSERAASEARNQSSLRAVEDAVRAGNLATAKTSLEAIARDSVYRDQAQQLYGRGEKAAVEALVVALRVPAANADCAKYNALVRQAEVARGTSVTNQARRLVHCSEREKPLAHDGSASLAGSGSAAAPADPYRGSDSGSASEPARSPAGSGSATVTARTDDGHCEVHVAAAQSDYLHGKYAGAIENARKGNYGSCTLKAWRLIGAAACFTRDRATAIAAWNRLPGSDREFIKYACNRNSIDVP